jgi:hypothetical protein
MASQQILFTVMPRGLTQGGSPLPVSVYVSPRLAGAGRLDAFPDWRHWTSIVQHGFQLTFRCGRTRSRTTRIGRSTPTRCATPSAR